MRSRSSKPYIPVFLGALCVLLLLGTLFVFEASGPESYQTFGDPLTITRQHAIGVVAGIIACCIAALIPVKVWFAIRVPLFIAAVILLVATIIPGVGSEFNGASRWLVLGPLVLQPVEAFKFALILFMSGWLVLHQRVGALLFTLAIPALVLVLQPDIGSLLVVLSIGLSMYFIAGGPLKQLGILLAAALPVFIILIAIAPYRLQRVVTFFNPESDPQGSSFHVRQLTLALGRGGLVGQGIGNSSQKFSYVPEASTDSIAAIIGEETGLIGLLLLLGIYSIIAVTGMKMISIMSGQARLFASGILIWIFVQMLLNIAAVSALVPLTGIPLPFISYGRSSSVMLLFAIGVFLRLYLQEKKTT